MKPLIVLLICKVTAYMQRIWKTKNSYQGITLNGWHRSRSGCLGSRWNFCIVLKLPTNRLSLFICDLGLTNTPYVNVFCLRRTEGSKNESLCGIARLVIPLTKVTLNSSIYLQFDAPCLTMNLFGFQKTWGFIDFLDGFDVVVQGSEKLMVSLISNVMTIETITILLY